MQMFSVLFVDDDKGNGLKRVDHTQLRQSHVNRHWISQPSCFRVNTHPSLPKLFYFCVNASENAPCIDLKHQLELN